MNNSPSIMTPTATVADGRQLLDEARDLHQGQTRAEADLLGVAARFADLHPPTGEYDTVEWDSRFGQDGVPLTAPGLPDVSAAAIAELATTLGQRHGAGRSLIAHALQLRHRLPRAWVMLHAYQLVPMVARRLAEQTFWCSAEAAAFVDAQVSAISGKLTLGQVERLVTAAILHCDPDHRDHDKLAGVHDPRGVWINHTTDGTGLSHLSGTVDVQDGLTLDAALDVGARELAAQPGLDDLTHQALRGFALGDLSRRQPGLDFTAADHATTANRSGDAADRDPVPPVTRPTKPVTLYVHLSETALTGNGSVGRVENTAQPVTTGRIREWFGDLAAKITVTPVKHSGEQMHSDAYEIPDRLIRQIELTELTCVFPWCDKPATRCDKDHAVPYGRGGQTRSHNLAPLCRTHHLLKTHTAWRYERLDPLSTPAARPSRRVELDQDRRVHPEQPTGRSRDRAEARPSAGDPGPTYFWTSPYGFRYRRDRLGTTADPPDASS